MGKEVDLLQFNRRMTKTEEKEVASLQKLAESDEVIKGVYSELASGVTFAEKEMLADKFQTIGDTLSEQYDVSMSNNPVLKSEDASSREKKRIARDYSKKKAAASEVAIKLHSRITELARNYRESSGGILEDIKMPGEMQRLMDYDLDELKRTANTPEVQMLETLKKSLPKLHENIVNLKHMCKEAVVDEDIEVVDYKVLAKGELAILEGQMEAAIQKIRDYLPVASAQDMKYVNHPMLNEVVDHATTPIMDPEYEQALEQSTQQVILEFDRDYDTEYDMAKAEYEQAATTEADERKVRRLKKKMLDLEQIARTAGEVKALAAKNNTSPETVQEVILDYLKKVTTSAVPRMKISTGACIAVIMDRFKCGPADIYDELVEKHFCADTALKAPDLIGFGYLGGEEVVNYKRTQPDMTYIYGQIAVTMNDEIRSRTTFVLGNSLNRYDKMRARSVDAPDLLVAGKALESLYKRALVTANVEELDVDEEAKTWDAGMYKYAECQYHGLLTVRDMKKLSLPIDHEIGDMDEADLARVIQKHAEYSPKTNKSTAFMKLYELVKVVNSNPDRFCRTDLPPLDIEIYGRDGVVLHLEDIDRLVRKYPIQ